SAWSPTSGSRSARTATRPRRGSRRSTRFRSTWPTGGHRHLAMAKQTTLVNAIAKRRLARDYAAGRSDARRLLRELEAAQLDLLDDERRVRGGTGYEPLSLAPGRPQRRGRTAR